MLCPSPARVNARPPVALRVFTPRPDLDVSPSTDGTLFLTARTRAGLRFVADLAGRAARHIGWPFGGDELIKRADELGLVLDPEDLS